MTASWHPTAGVDALKMRARMLQNIRAFFCARNVLEVDTPVLVESGITDLHIDSVVVRQSPADHYLQTSPEYAMKRLLCQGSGDIYQVCKVFRDGEVGRRHNPEFMLLEWYRLGMSDAQLAAEVVALICQVAERTLVVNPIHYADPFLQRWDIDIFTASTAALVEIATCEGVSPDCDMDKDSWLDLLFSLCIAPTFAEHELTVVQAFPASQAALARRHANGETAARFEVYWGEIELANGYHELVDAAEQRQRFEHDNAERLQAGKPEMPLDERFLAAMTDAELPDCAGVAIGLDRLLMCVLGVRHIDAVIAFPAGRT